MFLGAWHRAYDREQFIKFVNSVCGSLASIPGRSSPPSAGHDGSHDALARGSAGPAQNHPKPKMGLRLDRPWVELSVPQPPVGGIERSGFGNGAPRTVLKIVREKPKGLDNAPRDRFCAPLAETRPQSGSQFSLRAKTEPVVRMNFPWLMGPLGPEIARRAPKRCPQYPAGELQNGRKVLVFLPRPHGQCGHIWGELACGAPQSPRAWCWWPL